MPIQWSLLGNGFDPMEALRYAGAARQQQLAERQMQRQEEQAQRQQAARTAVAQRLGANDYQGATQAALEGGDFDLVKHITGLQADNQKRLGEEAKRIAGLAYSLRSQPLENRRAIAMQAVNTFGIDPSHIPEDLSDQSLAGIQAWATDIDDQVKIQLGEARIADISNDNARQERLAQNTIANAAADNARADRADARSAMYQARSDSRAAASRRESHVRFSERDKDRAAIAAGGRGVRTDLSDLDY